MVGWGKWGAERHEVDIVVCEVGGVQSCVDEAVVLGGGADEAAGAVDGFVGEHGDVRGLHERIAQFVVLAACGVLEEVRGEMGHDFRAVGLRDSACCVERAGCAGGGGQDVEE